MGSVITVNPGSNSLRLDLVDPTGEHPKVLQSQHHHGSPTSSVALRAFDKFLDAYRSDISGIAHRLVHGGEHFPRPRRVDEYTASQLHELEPLAPQHVPSTVQLVQRAEHAMPTVAQVVCPDTAFHHTMPEQARIEPLPARWRDQVRRFGFHGLSYAWAVRRTSELLGRDVEQTNALVAHLGGGCSACAVHGGQSVDTTMGFTPLGGITMTRRSGDVDPGSLLWILRHSGEGIDEVESGLQRESGLLGLSGGRTDDTRELAQAANRGDDTARLALRVFCRRVAAGVAAMATNLDEFDALVFTGEIGWNQPEVRDDVCRRLKLLGVPAQLSGNRRDDGPVSLAEEHPAVLVVEPREELQLAVEASHVLS